MTSPRQAGAEGLLLDSVAVWRWIVSPERLRPASLAVIGDSRLVVVSVATVWELEIKAAVGKLDLTPEFWPIVTDAVDAMLPIEPADAIAAARLPLHHRDPFDRLIVAQALARGLTVLTTDRALARYGVRTLAA